MLVLPLPPLQRMPIILVKLYTYQMLRALAHIHSIGVCHRWGSAGFWVATGQSQWCAREGPSAPSISWVEHADAHASPAQAQGIWAQGYPAVRRRGTACLFASAPTCPPLPRRAAPALPQGHQAAEPAGQHQQPRAQAVRLWVGQGAGARRAQHLVHLLPLLPSPGADLWGHRLHMRHRRERRPAAPACRPAAPCLAGLRAAPSWS